MWNTAGVSMMGVSVCDGDGDGGGGGGGGGGVGHSQLGLLQG